MSSWGGPLARFVAAMAGRLEANDHKFGWERRSPVWLLHRLRQETAELERALSRRESAEKIRHEAADVANFAMMIADTADLEDLDV